MSTIAVNSVTDANGGNTATINSMTPTADSLQGFRNRIINGDMRIDQRNAGAAVTANDSYVVDRFVAVESTDGAYSAQRDTLAPPTFTNSLKWTTTTADASLASNQWASIRTFVEGFNVADLGWGSANAKTITLSFWVRSSITGTFSGSVANGSYDRSYPFNYTISVADTWEYKTITIPGDTTGTWVTDNGLGLRLYFSLGAGSNYTGTAGSWNAAGWTASTTGTASVIGTLNATWYITGVQLEVGSVATPFERRPYGTELSLCQRYCYALRSAEATGNYLTYFMATANSASNITGNLVPKVTMRATPTLSTTGTASNYAAFDGNFYAGSAVPTITSDSNSSSFTLDMTVSGAATGNCYRLLSNNNKTSYLIFNAEL